MNYIDEIFQRLNLQQIREFLRYGTECIHTSDHSYYERIGMAQKEIINIVKEKFPNSSEYEEMIGHVFEYAGIMEDVYMEIGLQCGIILIIQFLTNFQKN